MLDQEYTLHEHISESLAKVLNDVCKKNIINRLIYVNGPGSFMGLKIAYVMLKSFSIIKKCDFLCIDGFELSKGEPIRATKTMSFVKSIDKNGALNIELKNVQPGNISLLKDISLLKFSNNTLPQYFTAAV